MKTLEQMLDDFVDFAAYVTGGDDFSYRVDVGSQTIGYICLDADEKEKRETKLKQEIKDLIESVLNSYMRDIPFRDPPVTEDNLNGIFTYFSYDMSLIKDYHSPKTRIMEREFVEKLQKYIAWQQGIIKWMSEEQK